MSVKNNQTKDEKFAKFIADPIKKVGKNTNKIAKFFYETSVKIRKKIKEEKYLERSEKTFQKFFEEKKEKVSENLFPKVKNGLKKFANSFKEEEINSTKPK